MKGKIDRDGRLWIERAGNMKLQNCALTLLHCCDECPLFEEPRLNKEEDCEYTTMHLCHYKHLIFDHFTDERKAP